MKFEHTLTSNWENAFRGLRNPMNSWEKSDSYGGLYEIYNDDAAYDAVYSWMDKVYPNSGGLTGAEWYNTAEDYYNWFDKEAVIRMAQGSEVVELFFIGPNDMDLAQRMIAAGSPNDKFLRQIFVSVDITAPLYWWKEMDTYKIGTVTNSTSTMHKLASTPITIDCFEMDDFVEIREANKNPWELIINICEDLRNKYNETKDTRYWKELIRILPESWLQTRTWTANYAVLRNILHWRKDHKLSEWKTFCYWIKTLPYSSDLIFYKN